MWSFYLTQAEKHDRERVDGWKGNMDGLLIFTGLFSATVAVFLIQSYQLLQPDNGAATVLLLSQILGQLNETQSSSAFTNQPVFPRSSILVNSLWLLSLGLSVTCALVAVMIQQWGRRYLQAVTRSQQEPGMQARIQLALSVGMEKYGLETFIATVPLVLHASVFSFFIGLVEFYGPVSPTASLIMLIFLCIYSAVFFALTIAPAIFIYCPFDTPLS
ncbi:hypothetical protein K488DRAFT_43749, partial [Vararia minispora EC-137]